MVKKKMLEALDKYKDRYKTELGILEADLDIARKMITCGIDRLIQDVKKADKRALELDNDTETIGNAKEQLEPTAAALDKLDSVDKHCHAVVATFDFWFQDFDCGQILADALSTPVCIYPSNDNDKPFTFLPLDLPKEDQRIKSRPIHLQHNPLHWISLRFSATHSGLPAIYYDMHWNKKENMSIFLGYWNRWGQFPKCVDHLLPTAESENASSAITLELDDEEIIDSC